MNEIEKKAVANFNSSLEQLELVLTRVPDRGWDWLESEGEWSIRQVIYHLAEDLIVYGFILERTLATPGCNVIFGEFPGNEEWADRLGFDKRPVNLALDLIRAQRPFFADLLSRFPEKWGNVVLFYDESGEKLGESNIEKMVMMLSDHMLEHVKMIENIIKANL